MQSLETRHGMSVTPVQAFGLEEATEQLKPIARVQYVQLEPGAARVQGVIADLGTVLIARVGGDRNKIERAETPPGKLVLFVPTRGLARLGTATVQCEDAVLVSRATQVVAYTDRHFLPLAVAVSLYRCREVAAMLQCNLRFPQDAISLLRVSTACVLALDRLAESLFTAADMEPAMECTPGRTTAVEERVLRWLVTLLSGEQTLMRPSDGAASRRRAVLRAREFIDAHLDQPLSLPRICRSSYSSARALEYGFREMFGVPPMTYARCARLSRVRRDLYNSEPRPKTVTRLAMKWGFLHLGQFSRDYRTLFGESPSMTLARSAAQPAASIERGRALYPPADRAQN